MRQQITKNATAKKKSATHMARACWPALTLFTLFPERLVAQPSATTRPEWLEGSITLPFELVGLVVGVAIASGLVHVATRWLRPTTQTQADRERRSRPTIDATTPQPASAPFPTRGAQDASNTLMDDDKVTQDFIDPSR